MRFLGIGETNQLGSMYLDLMRRGHQVKVFIEDEAARDTLAGLVEIVTDWKNYLDKDTIVLFESAKDGALQDQLRRDGYKVIGGSAFGDRLEKDRAFGQQILRDAGLQTAPVHELQSFSDARRLVEARKRRFVIKMSGDDYASSSTYVGQLEDGRDLIGYLRAKERGWRSTEQPTFVLMEHLEGIECGVGAYFNGHKFIGPVCIDFEHKRFFPGDLGEMTGEMGTLVSYRGSELLFDATLSKLADRLREGRYCGYINLNTMVNERGVWPLELTARFGYPGFAILQALHISPWEDLLVALVEGSDVKFETHDGYAVGVVITVPSFPSSKGYEELGKGMPILFRRPWTREDEQHLHFSEAARVEGELVTAGMVGYVMVVTGRGATIAEARAEVYGRVANLCIPNMRYRNDIASRSPAELERLEGWGWMPKRSR